MRWGGREWRSEGTCAGLNSSQVLGNHMNMSEEKSQFSLRDWVSFLQGYKSWITARQLHFDSQSLLYIGAIIALGGGLAAFGSSTAIILYLMTIVPLLIFGYILFARKKQPFRWFLIAMGAVHIAIGLLGFFLGESGGTSRDTQSGLSILLTYYMMSGLGILFVIARRWSLQFSTTEHGLDMLIQAIMIGKIRDSTAVRDRFLTMVSPVTQARKEYAIVWARFLCTLEGTPTEGLSDDLLHEWIVKTGGYVSIQRWIQDKHTNEKH